MRINITDKRLSGQIHNQQALEKRRETTRNTKAKMLGTSPGKFQSKLNENSFHGTFMGSTARIEAFNSTKNYPASIHAISSIASIKEE